MSEEGASVDTIKPPSDLSQLQQWLLGPSRAHVWLLFCVATTPIARKDEVGPTFGTYFFPTCASSRISPFTWLWVQFLQYIC